MTTLNPAPLDPGVADAWPVEDRRTEGGLRRIVTPYGRLVALGVLISYASCLAVVAWPGRMSADTLRQIEQVRLGRYDDWHAALLLVLWRPFWLLGVGPGWVTWAAIVTFVLGLYGLLRMRLGRLGACGWAIVITSSPPVVGYVVYLGRDTWFTSFFLVACAALVRAAASSGRAHRVALGLTVVAGWLMLAARQNAVPTVFVLLLAAAALNWRCAGTRRCERLRRAGKVVLAATAAVLVLMLSQAGLRRAFGVEHTHPEQTIYIYDLAALSHATRQVLLDPVAFPSQSLAVLDASFTPERFDTLVFGADPPVVFPLPDDEVERLRSEWLDAVLDHPIDYLEGRLDLWLRQVSVTQPSVWIAHPGIDANAWGYTATFPLLDHWLENYVVAFAANENLAGGPVHTVWIYLLVLAAGLLWLRSTRAEYRSLGWICLSCFVYQATLFVGLMGVGYRLNLECVVIAEAVAVIAGADAVARVRRQRTATSRSTPVVADPVT